MNISIGTMIKTCAGLLGTKDLNDWEDEFLAGVIDKTENGQKTTLLSSKQVECISRIYKKHFGE